MGDDSSYDFAEPAPPKPQPAPRPAPPEKQPQKTTPDGATAAVAPKAATGEEKERTCLHCGYSFFGKIKARCPECAAPMDEASDLLQFASAAWVRTVALGFLLIIPAILCHAAGASFSWFKIAHAASAAHALGAVLLVLGVLIATRRPPDGPNQNRAVALWAQWLSLAALFLWLILIAKSGTPELVKPLVLLVLALQGVLSVFLAIYCNRLANRIPSDSLAAHATYTGWLTAVVCAALFGIQGLELTKGYFPIFFMCSYPLIAGLLAILLWTMITLLRVALDLRVSAAAGESIAERRQARRAAQNKPAPRP